MSDSNENEDYELVVTFNIHYQTQSGESLCLLFHRVKEMTLYARVMELKDDGLWTTTLHESDRDLNKIEFPRRPLRYFYCIVPSAVVADKKEQNVSALMSRIVRREKIEHVLRIPRSDSLPRIIQLSVSDRWDVSDVGDRVNALLKKGSGKLLTSEEDEYKAILKAVERNVDWAKTKLAWYKLSGSGGCRVDEEGAVALLEERVKNGDAEAMWMLGVCNEFGRGTEQDIERAEMLYRQSKEEGNKIVNIILRNSRKHELGSGFFELKSLPKSTEETI